MSKRFGSTTMIAGAMASAIGFYTLSLHVSAERGEADRLRARIASDLKDIRALEAELRTRARLPVLQKWNDDVLAMAAPSAKQFVDSPVQLASFAPRSAAPAAVAEPTVQLALATEEMAVQKPMLVKASYQVPTTQLATYVAAPVHALAEPAEADTSKRDRSAAKAAEPKKAEAKVAKAEPKPESKPAKAENKPAAAVKLADAKPKPAAKATLAGLDSLSDVIDSAAAAERGSFRKVAMR